MVSRKDTTILWFFLLFLCLLMAPIFFGKTLFIRDLTYIFQPWKHFSAEALQKGQMPLWDPYIFCGMPHLANWQSAVLYPLSLPFYIFGFVPGLKIYHLTHLFLAGLFAYLFGRSIGWGKMASATTMIIFSANGYMLSHLEFLGHIGTDTWTFALLLFSGQPVLLAIAITLAFLAGHQIFLYQILFVILFILTARRTSFFNSVRIVSFAGITAISLCIVQLLPTIELAMNSARILNGGVETAVAFLNSVSLKELAGIISPYLLPLSPLRVPGEHYFWAATFFTGIVAILLAIKGGFSARVTNPSVRVWGMILIFSGILLSLGDSTPVYPWFYQHLPALKFMRYPAQFMLFAIIGIALLAGTGIDRRKYSWIFLLCIAAELLCYGASFQSLADNSYFSVKHELHRILQQPAYQNKRFILSPSTESHRDVIAQGDPEKEWQDIRSCLYNLTCIPYHIYNANGSGEPFTLKSIEQRVDTAYRHSPQMSIPGFQSMGINYLICRTQLPDSTGYSLAAQTPFFVYKLSEPGKRIERDGGTAMIISEDPGRSVVVSEGATAGAIILRDTWYPGWAAYVSGQKTGVARHDALVRSWNAPQGKSISWLRYQPASFSLGLFVSIISIIATMIFGIIRLKRFIS